MLLVAVVVVVLVSLTASAPPLILCVLGHVLLNVVPVLMRLPVLRFRLRTSLRSLKRRIVAPISSSLRCASNAKHRMRAWMRFSLPLSPSFLSLRAMSLVVPTSFSNSRAKLVRLPPALPPLPPVRTTTIQRLRSWTVAKIVIVANVATVVLPLAPPVLLLLVVMIRIATLAVALPLLVLLLLLLLLPLLLLLSASSSARARHWPQTSPRSPLFLALVTLGACTLVIRQSLPVATLFTADVTHLPLVLPLFMVAVSRARTRVRLHHPLPSQRSLLLMPLLLRLRLLRLMHRLCCRLCRSHLLLHPLCHHHHHHHRSHVPRLPLLLLLLCPPSLLCRHR